MLTTIYWWKKVRERLAVNKRRTHRFHIHIYIYIFDYRNIVHENVIKTRRPIKLSGDDVTDLHFIDIWFESQLGYLIFWLTLVMGFLSTSRQILVVL
jgi:hypothetical protein